jgi:hypothetical protein
LHTPGGVVGGLIEREPGLDGNGWHCQRRPVVEHPSIDIQVMDKMPRTKTRIVLISLTGVLVATAVAILAGRHESGPAADVLPATAASALPGGTAPLAATRLADSGVQADWVVQENQLNGSTGWRISGAPTNGFIEGFADHTYATVGQPIRVYVSTSAPTFHIEAYRIGYYGGAGGRLMWASVVMPGRVQPKCPLTTGINMVSCANWASPVDVQITEGFTQGDYLLKLIGAGNEQSYVPLTVWDPTSHAAYLVKNDVYTWQAWNYYGGYDYYQGVGKCPAGVFPLCTRSRVVSYDRPYSDGDGSGQFLSLEAPLVRFLEQHGLDVTYVNDLTVQEHPEVLDNHHALVSPGHDECWSLGERNAVVAASKAGLNLAFFGASAVLRHVRTQSSPLGEDRELVDYRDAATDPLRTKDPQDVTANTWGSAPSNLPASQLVGEAYNGSLNPGVHEPMTVTDPSAWIFAGAGLANSNTLPDVIASDVDSLEPAKPADHPANVQILAHSPLPISKAQSNSHKGTAFYADMTYYTDPTTKAGIWDSGTANWIPALASGKATAAVQAITTNVLWLFGQSPAGNRHPSVPNWHDYY